MNVKTTYRPFAQWNFAVSILVKNTGMKGDVERGRFHRETEQSEAENPSTEKQHSSLIFYAGNNIKRGGFPSLFLEYAPDPFHHAGLIPWRRKGLQCHCVELLRLIQRAAEKVAFVGQRRKLGVDRVNL